MKIWELVQTPNGVAILPDSQNTICVLGCDTFYTSCIYTFKARFAKQRSFPKAPSYFLPTPTSTKLEMGGITSNVAGRYLSLLACKTNVDDISTNGKARVDALNAYLQASNQLTSEHRRLYLPT